MMRRTCQRRPCGHFTAHSTAQATVPAAPLVAVLAVALAAALAGGAVAQEMGPEEAARLFRQANALYAEGTYGAAAEIYEVILEGGFENAEVHYNLANARYKDGELGRAVLCYERALRLDGSHEDALANLEFVRGQLADRQVAVGGQLSTAVDRFVRQAATGRLAVFVSLFYFILVAAVIAGVLRGGFTPWLLRLIVVMIVHVVVSGAILAYRVHRASNVHEAVIVAMEVPVRTGPGDDFVLEFKLHEGTKVRVREEREDWLRVSVEGTDLEGWLPKTTLEHI